MDIANFVHIDKYLEQYLNVLVRKIRQTVRTNTGASMLYNGDTVALNYGQAVRVTPSGEVHSTDASYGAIGVCDRRGGCPIDELCPVSSNGEHTLFMQTGLTPQNGDAIYLDVGSPGFTIGWGPGRRFVGYVKEAAPYAVGNPYLVGVINMPIEAVAVA